MTVSAGRNIVFKTLGAGMFKLNFDFQTPPSCHLDYPLYKYNPAKELYGMCDPPS